MEFSKGESYSETEWWERMYTSVIVCASCSLIYFIASMIMLNLGFDKHSSALCDILNDVNTFLFTFVLFSVNFFLWLRQRTFYSNNMLNMNFSRIINYISFSAIFFILAGGLMVCIIASFADDVVSSEYGCSFSTGQLDRGTVIGIGVALSLLGQITLLSLFIYPLYKSSHSMAFKDSCFGSLIKGKNNNSDSAANEDTNATRTKSSDNPQNDQLPSYILKSNQRVRVIIIKTFIFAVLSIFCDLLTAVLPFVFTSQKHLRHRRYVDVMGLVDIALNLIFVLLSFVEWKEMLTSPLNCIKLRITN